jgi:hypothetical protein
VRLPLAKGTEGSLAGFHRQLVAAGRRQPVVLRSAAQLRDNPLGFDPPLVFDDEGLDTVIPVDLQDVLGDLLNSLRNRLAVERLGLQRPKNEQVERARKTVGNCVSSH